MPKLSLVVRGAICLLFIFLPLHALDQWFYDQFFRLRGTRHKTSPFIIVQVDDAQLYSLMEQRKFYFSRDGMVFAPKTHAIWYRQFYENIVEKIQAGSPKIVVFTSFFNWLSSQKEPTFNEQKVLFSAAFNEQGQLVLPAPSLTHSDNWGFSNIFPDQDNVVRQYFLTRSDRPSLAVQIYHRLKDRPIKYNLEQPIRIDFQGPSGTYPSVDAWSLFSGAISPEIFKDRIVLIGKASHPLTDFETPFGSMSSAEVHANTVDTLTFGRSIRWLPRWVTWTIAALAVGASIAIIILFPLTLAWLFLLLLALIMVLITLFAFSQLKVWWGLGNPLFCIFGTHLLLLGYKLGLQEEEQWKIQQIAKNLREIDQFKNNFISLFSHDLKTPIAKITAIVERVLTSKKDLDSETQEALKSIAKTNGDLARLISDILKVTKMESMAVEVRREVVDLNRLVEQATQRLQFQANEKGIKIILDLEPLFSMEGDANLLLEVIHNLVDNAIKYSHPNSQVIVRTAEEEGFVRVSVKDQGVGIPPDEIPRVTAKFYRGRSTADKSIGSGLGLYLARYFVELHEGRLDISSKEGEGTTISFSLPIPEK